VPLYINLHTLLLQDVSDLLEKEPEQSAKVVRLESNARNVIRKDWSQHITESLRTGTMNTVLSSVVLQCLSDSSQPSLLSVQ